MIPVGFNPDDFKNDWFISQNGLVTLDYENDWLIMQFQWVCANLGQTVIDITVTNALANGLEPNKQALNTGIMCLAHYLYCIQYNLLAQVIDGHKGQEGATFALTSAWRNSWDKSAYGGILADIMENNVTMQGHNGLYIWDQVTG